MDVLFETFPKDSNIDARLVELGANWKIALRGEIDPGDDAILKVWPNYPAGPAAVTLLATVNKYFAIYVPA